MSDSMYSMTPPVSPTPQHGQEDVEMIEDLESQPLILLEELEENVGSTHTKHAVCFHCQGDVFPRRGARLYEHATFHDKSLLKSGVLARLVLQVPSPDTDPDWTVELFGYSFPFTALRDRMEKLFRFARQTVTEIQNSADEDGPSMLTRRQDIIAFLEYVNIFVQSCLPEGENERRRFLRSLLRQLHLLLVHCGRISEEALVTKYTLDQLGRVHHNFHHRLEMSWYLLVIYHTLTSSPCASELPLDLKLCQWSTGDDEVRSVFDQLMSIVLHDLVNLAVPIFEKLSPHEWLYTSPFSCACVMEMWIMVICLLGHRKETFHTESFWVQLHRVLQITGNTCTDSSSETEEDIDSDVFLLMVTPIPSRPHGFSLWLTTHIAHLFTFHHHGNLVSPDPTQNCFFALQMTVEKIMRTTVKEETLRACLRCCLTVSSLWAPPNRLLTLLWEHFSRRLNDRFQLHTSSIEGLAVINKSSKAMLNQCRKWCSADDNGHWAQKAFDFANRSVGYWALNRLKENSTAAFFLIYQMEQETSFRLFLRLLASLLSHNNALTEWRHMKGRNSKKITSRKLRAYSIRFLSKFHQRRMQELGETGLHNMTCIFLTVALCVDSQEVARKLLGLYDMVDPTSTSGRLRAQIWCGALAVTQLLVKQGDNFSFLAEKLASSFDSMAKQLSGSAMDYSQKQGLSPLITLYIDGVQDIVEQSKMEGVEHLFIGEGIDTVLRSSSDSQMRHILTALDSIVMRLRCLVNEQKHMQPCIKESQNPTHVAFADRLWLHVFPFICDHAMTLTPPLSLADLAVSFTHLAQDFPAPLGVCPGGPAGVVRQFVATETIHPSITCHYLAQVLGDTLLYASVVLNNCQTCPSMPSLSKVTINSSLHKSVSQLSQTDIMKCWWRCVLLMAPTSSSLVELSQHVMSLPDVQWLMSGHSENGDGDAVGPMGWKQLLKAIGSRFQHSQSLLDKQKVRTQAMPYFTDTAQQVAALVRASKPLDTLLNVYRVVGCLVKHCAPLLYLQSKPCPLPEIIKTLILPAAVFNSDRPLNANFLAAIRDTLHLFLMGLGQLDYRRDSYVQRQVRSIVNEFLPRFALSPVDVYSHPVLQLLGRLPHQRSPTSGDFDSFVVDLVMENLRKNSTSVSGDVMSALRARSVR